MHNYLDPVVVKWPVSPDRGKREEGQERACAMDDSQLGSPVVPSCPFYSKGFLLKLASKKKGTLIGIGVLIHLVSVC